MLGNNSESNIKSGIATGDCVSVVVPVYNVERYLADCLESLLCQSYSNLEIILIDDGSTDKCGQICDSYSCHDDRVVVIHKDNAGLSSARNTGTSIAHGEWLVYVDSDDVVHRDYIKELLYAATSTGSDVACCLHQSFSHKSEVFADKAVNANVISLSGEQAAIEMFSLRKIYPSAWGKLARTELWKSIAFPEGRRFEDLPVIWKILAYSHKVVSIQEPLYFYRRRAGSIVSSASDASIKDLIKTIKQVEADTSTSPFALSLKNPARFLLSVECCRLYRMGSASSEVRSDIKHQAQGFATAYVRKHLSEAVVNGTASAWQRLRVLAFAIAPKLSIELTTTVLKRIRG
ncbi:glycosyltransferase [Collinsella tanakaei]|nr:glycosyltransferase [Collinsella tanakaei]